MDFNHTVFIDLNAYWKAVPLPAPHHNVSWNKEKHIMDAFDKECGIEYVAWSSRLNTREYRVVDPKKFQLARLKHGI